MKRTVSERRNTRSSVSSRKRKSAQRKATVKFALCMTGNYGDLRPSTLYRILPDADAKKEGFLRVVDDSGEDYLYPAKHFEPMVVRTSVASKLRKLNACRKIDN